MVFRKIEELALSFEPTANKMGALYANHRKPKLVAAE